MELTSNHRTQRTCNVFRFVHSGCKGCDGAICMCGKMRVLSLMSTLLEFVPQRLSVRIPNLCCCMFDPCFWWYFNSDHVISFSVTRVQRKQISRIRWYGRALDTLVIVTDRRLKCELPRSCCKQECGDVGISTPNTLRCMRCHSTALFVWFDARTSRFCYFRMFFSFSNF